MAGPQQRAAPALVFELSAVEASASTLLVRGLHHGQAPHAEARHHAAPQVAAARWLNFPPPSHKAQPHAAADRLNTQLQSLEAPGSLHVLELDAGKQQQQLEQQQGAAAATASSSSRSSATTAATSTTPESSWGRRLCGLALRVGDMTQPQGEAPGDASWGERTFNVLTSLPFVAVGWHMHRCVVFCRVVVGWVGDCTCSMRAALPMMLPSMWCLWRADSHAAQCPRAPFLSLPANQATPTKHPALEAGSG